MDDNKLKVADFVQILGLLLFGLGVFIGLHYYFIGDWTFSISLTAAILVPLTAAIYFAAKLKGQKQFAAKNRPWEYLLLFFSACCFILGAIFFIHFYRVNFTERIAIQNQLRVDNEQIGQMFVDYEENYIKKGVIDSIQNILKLKKESGQATNDFGLDGVVPDDNTIADVSRATQKSLCDTTAGSPYKKLKSEADGMAGANAAVVNKWKVFQIPGISNKINEDIKHFERDLIKFSKMSKNNANAPYSYANKKSTDTDTAISKISFAVNWPIVLLLLAVIALLIYWPFIFTQRKSGIISGDKGKNTIIMK